MAMDPFLGKAISTAVQTGTSGGGASSQSLLGTDESPFKSLMDQMGSDQDLAASLNINPGDLDPTLGKFKTVSAEGFDPSPEHLNVGAQEPTGMEFAVDMLSEMNSAHHKMEGMMNKLAYSNEQINMKDLIRIQANIYVFTQEIEIGVKVASEGVSSLKTIMNTQVQ